MPTQVNAWQTKDGLFFCTFEEAERYEKDQYKRSIETIIIEALDSVIPVTESQGWSNWPGTVRLTRVVFDALANKDLLK